VFHVAIWGGLSPPKPLRGDGTDVMSETQAKVEADL